MWRTYEKTIIWAATRARKFAAKNESKALQDCAAFADRIATMIEQGAGEAEPGERVRQVESYIRKFAKKEKKR